MKIVSYTNNSLGKTESCNGGGILWFCLRYAAKTSAIHLTQWNAVYALTTVEFESKIAEMMEISQNVIP